MSNVATSDRPVVIVGGGLAGMSAAVRLAEREIPVLLLEATHRLGGRAGSFIDRRTAQMLDRCQHVAMGCCTAYLDFCDRLGVADRFEWSDETHWYEPGGRVSTLRASSLPAPLHSAPSFLFAGFLSLSEKLAAGRALRAISKAEPEAWADRTFAEFLDALDQPKRVRDRLWSPVIVSACNTRIEDVAAPAAFKVFTDGLLAGRDAMRIGVPTCPLLEIHRRALDVIEAGGGVVREGARVETIESDHVVLKSGERIEAARVICALPFERAAERVDDPRLADIGSLSHSPIVGVHLRFDRPVLPVRHAVLLDVGTQWLFRKDKEGRDVHAVISAADDWVGLDDDAAVGRVLADVRMCLPGSGDAELEWGRAIREVRATFSPTVGGERARPEQDPGDGAGVILAGDYTRTGWPATMEGAVRSGVHAAEAVLGLRKGELLGSTPG